MSSSEVSTQSASVEHAVSAAGGTLVAGGAGVGGGAGLGAADPGDAVGAAVGALVEQAISRRTLRRYMCTVQSRPARAAR